MFLLCGCGGLRCGIAALHGDLTWMFMDRHGLGWIRVCFLNQDFQDYEDFQDWDDAVHRFSPSPRPSPIKGEGE